MEEYVSTMQRKVEEIEEKARKARERAQLATQEAEKLDDAAAAYRSALAFELGKQESPAAPIVADMSEDRSPPTITSQNGDLNVAKFIRDFVTNGSGVKAREVREALEKVGGEVRPNYLYSVLSRAKESGLIAKRRDKYYPKEQKGGD